MENRPGCVATLMVAFLLAVVSVSLYVHWYDAGIQADVYRRQGVEMTQWEVFRGATPAERLVNIKEKK